MKFRTITTLFIASSASLASAGGFETGALSTAFMYEDGSYSEASYGSRSPSVTDDKYAPTGSALKDISSMSFAFKADVMDNLAIGLSSYNQGAVQLDYSGAGATAVTTGTSALPVANQVTAAALPVIDLTINAITLQAKYDFSDNISTIAGIKITTVKDASANIFQSALRGASTITGKSEMGYIVGASYSIPEIAFRTELLYETDTDFTLDTENALPTALPTGQTTGSIPDYMTLSFQSGVADGTLIFGSIRSADWKNHQLKVYPDTAAETSSFTNSKTYNVGVGRKINEALSLVASYSMEPKGDAASSSARTITNGYQGVTLAGVYSIGDAKITAGYNYTQVGDVAMTPAVGLGAGDFTGNTVTGFGIKVGYSF